MREGGVEPPRPKAQDPKSSASANFATLASGPESDYESDDHQFASQIRHFGTENGQNSAGLEESEGRSSLLALFFVNCCFKQFNVE